MRDDTFTTTTGIVNFHPTKGTHWVLFINECFILMAVRHHEKQQMTFKKVQIQNMEFRKTTVISQLIFYLFHISHKF